ncbi:MAG: hypothetical protein ACI95C_001578 [Pseudohongiellaceae bacterium]|jgi:hypothetical protein
MTNPPHTRLFVFPNVCLHLCIAFLVLLSGIIHSHAQQSSPTGITITRLGNGPIIGPEIDPSIGENIQGPSLIKVPSWVNNPLGKYYLYFADHKGLYIRLAYADELLGPWKIYQPGSLHIADSFFAATRPAIAPERLAELVAAREASGVRVSHDYGKELTEPHIASPDVHIDEKNQRIVMYYHGLEAAAFQHSRVALSNDGIHFNAREENLGKTYFRTFEYQTMTYAMAMPGQLYRSANGLSDFEPGPLLFEPTMRHSAVMVRDGQLLVFWTRVGDAPESIMLSTIELAGNWIDWQESETAVVLKPEFLWEGANSPIEPSVRSTAYGSVNQLRDPAVFSENGVVYLLYAVAGESGIALARVNF